MHDKFNIGLFNFGGVRRQGEEAYQVNLTTMPATVICMLECHEEHLRPILDLRAPPAQDAALAASSAGSPQGAAPAASRGRSGGQRGGGQRR